MTAKNAKKRKKGRSRLQFGPEAPTGRRPARAGAATARRETARPVDEGRGRGIIRASWWGTVALAVAAGAGLASESLVFVAFVVAISLFGAGIAGLLGGYARAIQRSREEEISLAGLFFLAGCAPRSVQVRLIGAFGAQLVIGFTAAAVGINTLVATSVLAPVYGLGLMGLWGGRHGVFPPRVAPTRSGGRR